MNDENLHIKNVLDGSAYRWSKLVAQRLAETDGPGNHGNGGGKIVPAHRIRGLSTNFGTESYAKRVSSVEAVE